MKKKKKKKKKTNKKKQHENVTLFSKIQSCWINPKYLWYGPLTYLKRNRAINKATEKNRIDTFDSAIIYTCMPKKTVKSMVLSRSGAFMLTAKQRITDTCIMVRVRLYLPKIIHPQSIVHNIETHTITELCSHEKFAILYACIYNK